ncbi:MAG: hypothetical protein ACI8QY_000933 [bacterium]|jgi:hypothetical protein
MKKLILTLGLFFALTTSAFAGLINTSYTHMIDAADVYDPLNNITLTLHGNETFTANASFAGQFDRIFSLANEANVIIFEVPDVDFFYNLITRFDLNFGETMFTPVNDLTGNQEIAFYSATKFQDVTMSMRGIAGQNFTDFNATGVTWENIRSGTYSPSTSVPEPATFFLFGLAITGLVIRKKYMARKS